MDVRRALALRNAYRRGEVAGGDHPHVLVAAMPKSGSSLLVRAVQELPGMRRIAVVRGHDRRENELALDPLVDAHDTGWVAQAHVRHSTATARMIHTFALTPVVGARDLADVCVSMHDHLLTIATVNPIAYVPAAFAGWPRARRLEFVVDAFVPWYLHFFLSWEGVPGTVRVDYAALVGDPRAQLARVAEAAGIAASGAEVDGAVQRALAAPIPTRNTVVEGRGRELPPAARARLRRLADYYAGHDLSPLGL